jgi:hypothetical protein
MSDAAEANLAYGYNLGSPGNDGWKLLGASEWGSYEFPWSDGGYDFGAHVERLIANPDLEVMRSGHHDVPGYVLVIAPLEGVGGMDGRAYPRSAPIGANADRSWLERQTRSRAEGARHHPDAGRAEVARLP